MYVCLRVCELFLLLFFIHNTSMRESVDYHKNINNSFGVILGIHTHIEKRARTRTNQQ